MTLKTWVTLCQPSSNHPLTHSSFRVKAKFFQRPRRPPSLWPPLPLSPKAGRDFPAARYTWASEPFTTPWTIRCAPAPGHLHWLFPVLATLFFLDFYIAHSFIYFQPLLKCPLLSRAFLRHAFKITLQSSNFSLPYPTWMSPALTDFLYKMDFYFLLYWKLLFL